MVEQKSSKTETSRRDDRAEGLADSVAAVVLLPVAVARRVLPDRELPVYLGAGALAIAGVVDWPVAVAAGLGYAAVRRWTGRGEAVTSGADAT